MSRAAARACWWAQSHGREFPAGPPALAVVVAAVVRQGAMTATAAAGRSRRRRTLSSLSLELSSSDVRPPPPSPPHPRPWLPTEEGGGWGWRRRQRRGRPRSVDGTTARPSIVLRAATAVQIRQEDGALDPGPHRVRPRRSPCARRGDLRLREGHRRVGHAPDPPPQGGGATGGGGGDKGGKGEKKGTGYIGFHDASIENIYGANRYRKPPGAGFHV